MLFRSEWRSALKAVALNRATWPPFWLTFSMSGAFMTLVSLWTAPYLVHKHGLSQVAAGSYPAMTLIAFACSVPMIGWLSDRVRARRPITLACSIAFFGSGLIYLFAPTGAIAWFVATAVLAGVAVTSLATAIQTFVLQRNNDVVRQVYAWILGRLSSATWGDVRLVLPYVVVSTVVLLMHRRLLDVLRVGDDEAAALGANIRRVRLIVVAAATLGTAAVVAVSGLIGFVGIIVPHAVRLVVGASYRKVLPLSVLLGGAFLVLVDIPSRVMSDPAEIPIGVVTAFFGAPFFLLLLRTRETAQ